MALTSADLLAPTGLVEPSFFPDDASGALTTRLNAYGAAGDADATGAGLTGADATRAALAAAYRRAYDAAADVRLTKATSLEVAGAGTVVKSYSALAQQIAGFRARALAFGAEFDAIVASAAPVDSGADALAAAGWRVARSMR